MKEVWVYQVNMDQWIKGAPLNVARFKHRMVTCQGEEMYGSKQESSSVGKNNEKKEKLQKNFKN